ncbi:hypothetical protein QJS10_CPA02g00610 [Acorus calamus]|uniref:Uncharacterized protein n=1 Tax=Acorus calamus TaxID=4465 RepID=A0AAV9FEX8_ACOCL|nr:hypothetical protein QJS10_CPA02g00610 [Acorus calamus]
MGGGFSRSRRQMMFGTGFGHFTTSISQPQAEVHESMTLDDVKDKEPDFFAMVTDVLKRAEIDFGCLKVMLSRIQAIEERVTKVEGRQERVGEYKEGAAVLFWKVKGASSYWVVKLSRVVRYDEVVEYIELLELLGHHEISPELADKVVWRPALVAGFTVKSGYVWLSREKPPLLSTAAKNNEGGLVDIQN